MVAGLSESGVPTWPAASTSESEAESEGAIPTRLMRVEAGADPPNSESPATGPSRLALGIASRVTSILTA